MTFAMKLIRPTAIFLVLISPALAQAPGRSDATGRALTSMLDQFLHDAATGNRAGFEKFFADDVIYTRSAGVVVTKADILKSIDSLKPAMVSKTTYGAEDITIHDYGDTAIVAFRLVARTEHSDGKIEVSNYRNTGTFLRRNGEWQAVAWQSTKVPESSK